MKKGKVIAVIIVSALIIISFIFYVFKMNPDTRGYINNAINEIEGKTLNKKFETRIKSGNLSTDYTIDEALGDVKRLGLNTLNIPVVINIDNTSSSDMSIDKASERRAQELIRKLRFKKINVILEPYPWIANGSKAETEWNPGNVNEFFWNWKTKVLKPLIDDVAVPYHVDALNIGTSFVHMESNEGYWCDMIDYVREYYKGLITYRTSWWRTAKWDPTLTDEYNKKLNNSLFSKLDFISIAAYFELTGNDKNKVESLVSALQSTQIYDRKQNVKQQIENFHERWNKPIFFGELGFPKTDKASVHPWDPNQSKTVNNLEQANCFEAYRRTFENKSWLLGFSVFAVGEHSSDKLYYPSEESMSVIRNWYSK